MTDLVCGEVHSVAKGVTGMKEGGNNREINTAHVL